MVKEIWRSLVVGLLYVIVSMVTSSVGLLMGLLSPPSVDVNPTVMVLFMFISGLHAP